MNLLPELKEEIVDLINEGSGTGIKSTDVKLTDPIITDPVVKAVVSGDGGSYFGKKRISFERRDIGKFFLNIPLALPVETLGETFTGADVIGLLGGKWPGIFNVEDFLASDMAQSYQRDSMDKQTIQLHCEPDSLAWRGNVSVKFFITDRRIFIHAEDDTVIEAEDGQPLETEDSPS